MTDLIFLDTETTGLDPDKHEIWEVAWAVNDEPIQERLLLHSLATADHVALEINGYYAKNPVGTLPGLHNSRADLELKGVLRENVLVCANPTFDRMFLRKRWGAEPYQYRSIDVESMAFSVLQYERPKGLKDIAKDLREIGYEIAEPNHSAFLDVAALRDCFRALQNEMTVFPRKVL